MMDEYDSYFKIPLDPNEVAAVLCVSLNESWEIGNAAILEVSDLEINGKNVGDFEITVVRTKLGDPK